MTWGVTAKLFAGVLSIQRTDPAQPVAVDVMTVAVGSRRSPVLKGTVVVEGVAKFNARRVRSISISSPEGVQGITVHQSSRPIPVRVQGPATVNQASATPMVAVPVAPAPAPVVAPPATPAPVPVAPPIETGLLTALEQQIVDQANAQRAAAGLAPLHANLKLSQASQIHAHDMALEEIMEHTLSDVALPDLKSRANYVGFKYGWLGENIARGYNDGTSVTAGWMASPGHRANILNPNYTEIGVGVRTDAQGILYFCEEFGSLVA